MYFNIKCIGKLPGPTNEFERSLVFETGEFERPKFDCMVKQVNIHVNFIEDRYMLLMSKAKPLHAVQRRCFFFGSLLLFMFHFSLCYAVLSVHCGLVVSCWDGLASCVWCFIVFLFLFQVVSRVRCCACLYRFLIFAFIFT